MFHRFTALRGCVFFFCRSMPHEQQCCTKISSCMIFGEPGVLRLFGISSKAPLGAPPKLMAFPMGSKRLILQPPTRDDVDTQEPTPAISCTKRYRAGSAPRSMDWAHTERIDSFCASSLCYPCASIVGIGAGLYCMMVHAE